MSRGAIIWCGATTIAGGVLAALLLSGRADPAPLHAKAAEKTPAAGGDGRPDAPLVALDEGKFYRTVNGEPITGREVLDLVLERSWQKNVQEFVVYTLCAEEAAENKEPVSDADVEAELQTMIDAYAKQTGMNPAELKLDKLTKEIGLAGGVAVLRRQTKVNLGLLRVLQKEKTVAAATHTWSPAFKTAVTQRIDKLTGSRGVERDTKKLGAGEAVRIGTRSYSRDEVRAFALEQAKQIPLAELREKLELLTLEKLVQAALKAKGLALTEDDLTFQFSYLCRRKEAETGVNGRMVVAQDLQALGMTPDEFIHDRRFKADAGITRLAKAPLRQKQLRDEFAAHPERYKRNENLVAHILLRVLDPDGRPYTPLWKAAGHDAVNAYAARCREDQFTAARPKIEALVAAAKENFEETARKYSEDNATNMIGGKLGRIGKETVLVRNCDNAVRDAAVPLQPGEISGPVRSAFGWHLVKCLEKQDVTYEEAEERIYLQLIYESRDKLSAAMMQTAKIEDKLP